MRFFCCGLQYFSRFIDKINCVPQKPVVKHIDENDLPPPVEIDLKLIQALERLSLVNFEDKEGIGRLRASIRYAIYF